MLHRWFLPSFLVFMFLVCHVAAAELALDERPAVAGEWGYRPADNAVLDVTPPPFSWRPQSAITHWELECRSDTDKQWQYNVSVEGMNVHCPTRTFPAGTYVWRFRGVTAKGIKTKWSVARKFTISASARSMPMPGRSELLARVPKDHPRLFLRPEDVPHLQTLAKGRLKSEYQQLVDQCEQLLKNPPPTTEPPRYPRGMVRNSEAWRKMWWGNRTYTIRALNGAATLAFTRLLDGNSQYGEAAKRILLACAKWDPKGATGYRYNDEAGMPYAYYFVRTYSFLYDMLTPQERAECQRVMRVRGQEMYQHLFPRHLWRPYSSHSNRAWHFLGEIGVALHGDVPEADDWIWFAMNVFYNVYPVWSDQDGGWHEGFSYWSSYIGRFTWWADVMRATFAVNAYEKPYFSKIGYYPMYLLPPGKVGGGFGDLTAHATSSKAVPLVSQLAAQAGNGYWQWYVETLGGPTPVGGYVGFVRGALPEVKPVVPDHLPSSRLFKGVGQAVLNTTLMDAKKDVQIVFKSSPFGTQSHGYEANNSFLLWAYGQRLLIRSGYRDSYGTEHHARWMWSTRSVNNITVDGQGQLSHSAASQGRIVGFHTAGDIDYVVGEAGDAYRDKSGQTSQLKRFTRSILLIKPDLVIVYDQLVARRPASYTYWLHATQQFKADAQDAIGLTVNDVQCDIALLEPQRLTLAQTNQYDPNPRPRITLREWHLTAETATKQQSIEFVAVMRPYRKGQQPPAQCKLQKVSGGYVLTSSVNGAKVVVLLPRDDSSEVAQGTLKTTGRILIRTAVKGAVKQTVVTPMR